MHTEGPQIFTFTVARPGISLIDIYAARCYMIYVCVIALVCSAWTLSNYMNGNTTMRAYAWTGTVASALLVLGLLTEGAIYRRSPSRPPYVYAEAARQRGVGVSTVHVATATIGVFSVCVAAVNIYGNASSGLYGMSCAVIVVNWLYYVMFTPNTVMHLALSGQLSDAENRLLVAQQNAIQLVWRRSSITPTS